MKDNLAKMLSYLLWGLMGISVLLTVIFYFDVITEEVLINWTYVLLAIASVAAIVFPIFLLAQDPKKAKGAAISLVGLALVLLVAYFMASDVVLESYEKYGVDQSTSKLVGMGILSTYGLLLVSTLGIFFFGIMNAIKS